MTFPIGTYEFNAVTIKCAQLFLRHHPSRKILCKIHTSRIDTSHQICYTYIDGGRYLGNADFGSSLAARSPLEAGREFWATLFTVVTCLEPPAFFMPSSLRLILRLTAVCSITRGGITDVGVASVKRAYVVGSRFDLCRIKRICHNHFAVRVKEKYTVIPL